MQKEELEYLKQNIKEKKLTYSELSNLSKVPLPTINNILSGKTPNPRIDTLEKLYVALNIMPYGKTNYQTFITKEEFCNYLLNDPTIMKYIKLKRKSDIKLVSELIDFLEYRYQKEKSDE